MLRFLVSIGIALLLVSGCASAPAPTATPTSTQAPVTEPTPTAEGDSSSVPTDSVAQTGVQGIGFEAMIDGAVEASMSGPGYYACENGRYVIRPLPDGLQQVTLILPADIVPGVYRLVDMGGNGPAATVSFSDGQVYAGQVDGMLVLNSLASAPDQNINGSFDFSASNGAGVVSARGEFDFTSLPDVLYCAQ